MRRPRTCGRTRAPAGHRRPWPRCRGSTGGAGRLHRPTAGLEVAVDLVGRDLDVARAVRARPLEQGHRPEHVGVHELLRAEDRAVDVGLGGEVDDRVAAVSRPRDGFGVGDVADDELCAGAVEIGGVPRVGQLVEDDDLVTACDEPLHEVRADEARRRRSRERASGEGYRHDRRRPLARPSSPTIVAKFGRDRTESGAAVRTTCMAATLRRRMARSRPARRRCTSSCPARASTRAGGATPSSRARATTGLRPRGSGHGSSPAAGCRIACAGS